jgi:carboxyl-terminal processing protease
MTQRVPSLLRYFAIFVLLLSLVPSALLARSAPARQEVATKDALSAKDRKEVFATVWKDIEERYYDSAFNGVDWNAVRKKYEPQAAAVESDAAFYSLIKHMVEELHDAHTRFSTAAEWENRQKHQGVSVGFGVDEVEGKTVVTAVTADSQAANNGIVPGMVVLAVDGQAMEARLAEAGARHVHNSSERADLLLAYREIFTGAPGSLVTLQLQRADGSTWETTVTRELHAFPPKVLQKRLPDGTAYIRFDEFQASTPRDVHEALEEVRNAPGLIIDLRGNGGGTLSSMLQIAGYLLPERTRFALDRTRSGKPVSSFGGLFKVGLELYAGRRGEQVYSGPVAILVRGRTASAAEIFSAGMQEAGRAKVFGSQTCGCVLGIIKQRKVRGGGVLEISEMLWLTPKGRKLEGEGVLPDREVRPTIADLQQKRDAPLEEAEKTLRDSATRTSQAVSRVQPVSRRF